MLAPMACIADAHADSLMWNRDLTRLQTGGHVDFPRLAQAKVGLQCFTLVTRGLPVIGGFPVFAAARGWPRKALASEWTRALWQIDHLATLCRRSDGKVSVAHTGAELEANLAAGTLSAVLGVEGAHALGGRVERVAELRARGVRFMGLTHLANNELGGSSLPFMGNRPLSAHGHEVLDEMARLGMPVDVAHASPRTLNDILAHPTARPFCSHTGVSGVTPVWRNLPDAALRRIADKGGVVGVIFAPQFLGGRELSDLVRHLEHAVKVMGEQGVGFGSDFDGMVPLPRGMRDVRDLPLIMAALRERGHAPSLVDRIAGENWRRFFGEVLGS